MNKRNVFVAIMLSALVIGCGKEETGTNNTQTTQKETVTEENVAKTEENTEKADTENSEKADTANSDNEEILLDDVYNWYVGDIWNPITDFREYIITGKNSCGDAFDAEFAYESYKKAIKKTDEYTAYIHENHPDIVVAWDKMMEQVDIVNANLADGFATGSEKIDTDLLSQYSQAFYDYYWENY